MTAPRDMARLIHINLNQGREGLLYATSPELKGLLVAAADLAELEDEIPVAITEMYEAQGIKMIVARVQAFEATDDYQPWVAIPEEFVRRALKRT